MPGATFVNWLRSAISAGDQIGFVSQFQPRGLCGVPFATTRMSMWRRARLRSGIGFVSQFQPKARYWVRSATTAMSMRRRARLPARIGFVPPKAAGNAGKTGKTRGRSPRFRCETGCKRPGQAAISRRTSGWSSARRISVFAAPLGARRPCSHCSRVRLETPSRAANCACVNPDFKRARTTGETGVRRDVTAVRSKLDEVALDQGGQRVRGRPAHATPLAYRRICVKRREAQREETGGWKGGDNQLC